MSRRIALALLLTTAGLGTGFAAAQGASSDASALALARNQAAEANRRSRALERKAQEATGEAARARAAAAALAARIQAAEAAITAAEARIRIIKDLRAAQRARLAERQEPVARLTAALQIMARRPPALALVQPGSLDDVVHVRSLLASTLPIIRQRTASLREEIRAGEALRKQAEAAVASLVAGQQELRTQRVALAQLEQRQRARSASLAESALAESDRALAFGEEARSLAAEAGTRRHQLEVAARLAELPGPRPRPGTAATARGREPAYRLPVEGRLVRGTGEISDAGVHARGLTFDTEPGVQVVAPAHGRVAYAGSFRGYGGVIILDHGGGWMSAITNLGTISVASGERVRAGDPVGDAGENEPGVSVELRRSGRPFPIAPLIG